METSFRFNITTCNLFLKFGSSERHLQGKDDIVSSTVGTAEYELPICSWDRTPNGTSFCFSKQPHPQPASHIIRGSCLTFSPVTSNHTRFSVSVQPTPQLTVLPPSAPLLPSQLHLLSILFYKEPLISKNSVLPAAQKSQQEGQKPQ